MRYIETDHVNTNTNNNNFFMTGDVASPVKHITLDIVTHDISNNLIDIDTLDQQDMDKDVLILQEFMLNSTSFQIKACTKIAKTSRRGCANTIVISRANFAKLFPIGFATAHVIDRVVFADVKDVYFCYQGTNMYDRSFVKISDKIVLHPDYKRMINKLSIAH